MRESEFIHHFAGKKITIMGLGLLGRGVGDAEFLARCGARVTVTDLKSRKELAASVARLREFKNIKFVLGQHREQDFTRADIVLKGAGVPLDSPCIAAARAAGVPVKMDESWFAEIAKGVRIVGITGTRGKSTTTQLIYETAKVAAKNSAKKVWLGGNVRGLATLPLLAKVRPGDTMILELSSWQLQGWREAGISPEIAVFTNFMTDHQNYYPTIRHYFADKASIFVHQKPGDVLIAGPQIIEKVRKSKPPIQPNLPPELPANWRPRLLGQHNLENIRLALAASDALKIPRKISKQVLTGFAGLAGRLEFVTERRGVKIINDNNATTPEALLAALRALPAGKIILLAGGRDKQLPIPAELKKEIANRVRLGVLLAGSGTDRLEKIWPKKVESIGPLPDLASCVDAAWAAAGRGDWLLFSPGFASFSHEFANEYERNDRFIELVKKLQ